jgi:hypothetical protein
MWQDATEAYNEIYKFASANAENFLGLQAEIIADLKGSYTTDIENAINGTRARLDAMLRDYSSAMNPIWSQYSHSVTLGPELDSTSVLTRLYQRFVDTAQRVTSRQFTYGAIVAGGSNTGSGTIYRLMIDANGFPIENTHAEARYAKCVADAVSGASRTEEIFEVGGAPPSSDALLLTGSGARTNITAISARASASAPFNVQNPSFDQVDGTVPSPLSSVPGWTLDSGSVANFSLIGGTEGTNYYRAYPGQSSSTSYALRSSAAFKLSQSLETNGASVDPQSPVFIQLAWKRNSSADGTINIVIGSYTFSVAVNTGTNGVWNTLVIPLDKNAWFKNWNTGGATGNKISIEWASPTTGTLDIDDFLATTFTANGTDGQWVAIVGGSPAHFLRNDSFTWTDSCVDSILQFWLWRAYGFYLPSAFPTPAGAPSAALAGAGAGNVDNGTHVYAYTDVGTGPGSESLLGAASASVNVVDHTTNGKVSVTSIAAGPAGTLSRNLYRSKAGTSTPFFFLATISGNVTTTYTDNTADSGLGAQFTNPTLVAEP